MAIKAALRRAAKARPFQACAALALLVGAVAAAPVVGEPAIVLAPAVAVETPSRIGGIVFNDAPVVTGQPVRARVSRTDRLGDDMLFWPAPEAGLAAIALLVRAPAPREAVTPMLEVADLTLSNTVAAPAIETKFGTLSVWDAVAQTGDGRHRCAVFSSRTAPVLGVAGWLCSPGPEAVDRRALRCFVDRLSMQNVVDDEAALDAMAAIERRRAKCTIDTQARMTRANWIERGVTLRP